VDCHRAAHHARHPGVHGTRDRFAGSRTDVDGAGLDLLEPADIKEVVAAHPRMDFKRKSLPTFAAVFKQRPDTTFGAITADVLAHFDPGFKRKDFVEVVQNNGWTE
jgi:hypothetical protein